MLDDLKRIAMRDKIDMLGLAEKQVTQLTHEFEADDIDVDEFTNVVVAAMGGSALVAEMVQATSPLGIPMSIVRSYDLPHYVDEHSLVVGISYSGNTEETVSVIKQALKTKAGVALITAGGELAELARDKDLPLISLTPNMPQPRMATLEGYVALRALLQAAGLLHADAGLKKLPKKLESMAESWRADVPTSQNEAKQLALELMGRSVVVYAGPYLRPLANKWKLALNETAKNLAWANLYPEYNHNEFTGWTSHPVDKPYAIINLVSANEHERVRRRFDESDKLLSGRRPSPHTLEMKGKSQLEQTVYGVVLADFVSIYLAILNNVDPAGVPYVDKLKQRMTEEVTGE